MPYRHAYLYILALIPFIGLAFWPNFFSVFTTAPLSLHIHGLTATLWIGLLIHQSWTIHHGHNGLHRLGGSFSLLLFPAFMMGGFMVLQTMGQATAAGGHFVYSVYGGGLGFFDTLAIATFGWLYYSALRHRRAVQSHARYMLATPLLLFGPIFARIIPGFVPGLMIRGPEDLTNFATSLYIALAGALLVAVLLWLGDRKHGQAFLIVAVVTVLQIAGFATVGNSQTWLDIYASFASLPELVIAAAGLIAGVLVVWLGWTGGRRAKD